MFRSPKGGVALWAHVGGFVAGFAVAAALLRPRDGSGPRPTSRRSWRCWASASGDDGADATTRRVLENMPPALALAVPLDKHDETFLFEMMIVGQYLGDPFGLHHVH